MTQCAYCGEVDSMTREHVIPAFMYEFQKEYDSVIGWSEPAEKMVRGELKVRDVCTRCNSENLASLDAYAKSFFVDNGLLVRNFTRSQIVLHYEHDQLLRWLLKVSYNSSRTDGAHADLFTPFAPYKIGRAHV